MYIDEKHYEHVRYNGVDYYYPYFDFDKRNFYTCSNDNEFTPYYSDGLNMKVRRNELLLYFISSIDDKISERKIEQFYKKFPIGSYFFHKDKKYKVSHISDNRYSSTCPFLVNDDSHYSIWKDSNNQSVYRFPITECKSLNEIRIQKINRLL